MQKLIKLNTDDYIIVDDSEIKNGDFMYNPSNNSIEKYSELDQKYWDDISYGCKKITYSTQPLELLTLSENGLSGMGFSKVRPLNIFNVKELIGEVDMEKKSETLAKSLHDKSKHDDWSIYDQLVYEDKELIKLGYNQALEDNKEKKYTRNEVHALMCKAFIQGWKKADVVEAGLEGLETDVECAWILTRHDSTPKTEWEVEIVDGKLKLK